MDMEVAVCYGPHDVRLEREPLEALGPGDVRVRVAYCGVCPWDLRVYSGRSSSARYPLHLGHEISGTVAEVGPEVRGLFPGQPVVVDAIRRCGVCAACRRGLENHCAAADYSRGGFARFILAPAGNVYPLRPATPLLHAAFAEPLACIVRAQNRLALPPGSTALVLGCGPLGLLHAQLLRHRGARVLAADPLPNRREAALCLKADAVLDPSAPDFAGAVAEHTDGWGVDAAVVATGAVAAARQALGLLAYEGTLLLFAGIHPRADLVLDPNDVHYRETWITGSADYTPAEFRESLALIENGTVQLDALVTDLYPLPALAAALDRVASGRGLKVMVQCDPSAPAGESRLNQKETQ